MSVTVKYGIGEIMTRREQWNTRTISCPSATWATRSAPMDHLEFEPGTQWQSAVRILFEPREENDL
jgi:hypothetical protein